MAKKASYLFLSAVQPEQFGFEQDHVSEMVTELADRKAKIIYNMDSHGEATLHFYTASLADAQEIVNYYNLDGILVEYTAIYDQTVVNQLVL
jgi:hypothetical protein